MHEADLASKMLRAVLQSHKNGVPFTHLQGEYKSLTGDLIPFAQLGHRTLEDYVKSIPDVVRIEISRTGEVVCHAVTCKETAGVAQLVARQRTSKKKLGRQVNCSLRLKKATSLASVGKPKGTLRKPALMNPSEVSRKAELPLLRSKGGSGATVLRPSTTVASHPVPPAIGSAVPRQVLMQRDVTVVNRPEKKVPAPQFQRELPGHLARNVSLDLNENIKEIKRVTFPLPDRPSYMAINEVQKKIKGILTHYSNGLWLSKIPHVYKEVYEEDFNTALLSQLEYWPHVCVAQKIQSGDHKDILLYPAIKSCRSIKEAPSHEARPPPAVIKETAKPKALGVNEDFKQKLAAILLKYASGLWASALPRVYEDMYRATFPQDVLNHLDSLTDICTVDYVVGNPKKAILYAKSKRATDDNQNIIGKIHIHEELRDLAKQELQMVMQEFQDDYSENIVVPPLIIPDEASPSVLVVELNTTDEVVIRYVGKDYSAAQELMEDELKDFYRQNSSALQMKSFRVGQLVAVPAEEEAWLRAQVVSTEHGRVKVCYVDYGFSEIVESTKVYKLAKQFFSLPFQASRCKLAGLEAFCDDPVLVKMVESLTCSKIFAVEILEKTDIPLVVLYDTSGADDININSTCLKALHDKSLILHLQVDALYTNVRVTNVCSDGTLYCQVPSKGLTKLSEVLTKLENYFNHKGMETSVSLPYCGKICLLSCKGKWARVEVTAVHSSRALDVVFLDSGKVTCVKVADLREIPPMFLRETIVIPPQAIKCCLADSPVPIGMWTTDAVLWLRDMVLKCLDCNIKVVKLDSTNQISHIYLFMAKSFPDPDLSINRQITNTELWKHRTDMFSSIPPSSFQLGKGTSSYLEMTNLSAKKSFSNAVPQATAPGSVKQSLTMPPTLPLCKPGEQMDVFIPLACHPGYFILQPWLEIHNLEVLLEEMLLYYSTAEERPGVVEKNKLYAAKIDNKWQRVLVKGTLANGLASVYELDYGKHELVNIQNMRPLPDVFRKLPFQALIAQLAGVNWQQWSEEASIVFRNHVEKKPLVALVEAVNMGANSWDNRLTVYLVDTSLPDTDIWIHDIMTQYLTEISKAT